MKNLVNYFLKICMIAVMWSATALCHDVSLPVIVDTDGGADDMRAMTLLMNAVHADIRLIVTSDGVLSPVQARESVLRLLSCMDRKGVPVVSGPAIGLEPPPFRKPNLDLSLSECGPKNETAASPALSASEMIVRTIQNAQDPVLYLCLGPLTNLATALKSEPDIRKKIERVVYLGRDPEDPHPGWNTLRDRASALAVYSSGASLYGLGLSPGDYLNFDEKFYSRIADTDSKAARLIARSHDYPWMRQKIAEDHMKVWDEMTVIYMVMITGFEFRPISAHPGAFGLISYDRQALADAYLKMIGNPSDIHLDARKSVVLKGFPMDASMMRQDVAPSVQAIIETHGAEEWKACLLTNELHRHLGIYSLVGAKMGVRARELLEAPFDTLSVVSHAGSSPPLSCMNDGLQVSTGASLGRGTITVTEDNKAPRADFIKGDTRLTLTLKADYVNRIKADIKAAIKTYGGLSPAYFAHIRTLSIRYWKEFDRNELFEERFSRE